MWYGFHAAMLYYEVYFTKIFVQGNLGYLKAYKRNLKKLNKIKKKKYVAVVTTKFPQQRHCNGLQGAYDLFLKKYKIKHILQC